jgi:hypothetical protein
MPDKTSAAAVALATSITNAPLDAETTVLLHLLDSRWCLCAHVTPGQIMPAGPSTPSWTAFQ